MDQPAPGLIFSTAISLSPRLRLFLDGQIGPNIYVFAQTRGSRLRPCSDDGAQIRLDEYFVRYTPVKNINLRGRTPASGRQLSPGMIPGRTLFINAPLPYEHLTVSGTLWSPEDTDELLECTSCRRITTAAIGSDNTAAFYSIWGPSYASGVAASGACGRFDYAENKEHLLPAP